MGKSSSPAAPDYTGAAQATAQGNLANAQQATQANRPNMQTPWGSSTWSQTPQYDMNAYNAAMAKYQASPTLSSNPVQYTTDGVPITGNGQSSQSGSNGLAPQLSDYSNGSTWSNNVSLAPAQQALLNQQNSLQQGLFGAQNNALQNVNNTMSQPFSGQPINASAQTYGSVLDPSSIQLGSVLNTNALPQSGNVLQNSQMYDPTKSTNNATDLIMQRINPQLDRQNASLQSQLAQQGVSQGSDAYNNAIESFNRSRNDAQNQAALSGINLGMQQSQLGTQQQGQQFGQYTTNRMNDAQLQNQQFGQTNANAGLTAQLQNQAFNQTNANLGLFGQLQNQGFNQAGYAYNLPMNTLNALSSGNQVSSPNFQSFANQQYTPGADYTGAANSQYQAALGNSNAQNASANNAMSGLFGLGGAAIKAGIFSDRRTKTNIRRVGRAENGLNIYSYQYKWGGPTMLGYMADEVEKIAPHAVGEVGGFKTVDYARI